MRYGYSFYLTAVEELGKARMEAIRDMAQAVRIGRFSKDQDFKRFIKTD